MVNGLEENVNLLTRKTHEEIVDVLAVTPYEIVDAYRASREDQESIRPIICDLAVEHNWGIYQAPNNPEMPTFALSDMGHLISLITRNPHDYSCELAQPDSIKRLINYCSQLGETVADIKGLRRKDMIVSTAVLAGAGAVSPIITTGSIPEALLFGTLGAGIGLLVGARHSKLTYSLRLERAKAIQCYDRIGHTIEFGQPALLQMKNHLLNYKYMEQYKEETRERHNLPIVDWGSIGI